MGRSLNIESLVTDDARPFEPVAVVCKNLQFAELSLAAWRMGFDYVVAVSGGVAHVGCAVLATPRPSLKEDGTVGSTASVINVSGHKDDVICRAVAERVCIATNATVACTGGVHVDSITAEQIAQVTDAFEQMTGKLIKKLMHLDC